MEATTLQVIPIFDEKNYAFWRIKMKTILITRESVGNGGRMCSE